MPRIEIMYTYVYTCVRMCVCVRLLYNRHAVCIYTCLTAIAHAVAVRVTPTCSVVCDSGKIGSHMLCDSVRCSV